MENQKFTMGLHYSKGEIFYSFNANQRTSANFESQFYTHFNNFQLANDTKEVRSYERSKSAIGELKLMHSRFFPFKMDGTDDGDFIFNLFRTFENFDVATDKAGFFIEMKPIKNESFLFYVKSKLQYRRFRQKLGLQFYKYMFKHQTQKNRKGEGDKYFKEKLKTDLFETKLYIIVQSQNKATAEAKIRSLANNSLVFKHYPMNQFQLKLRDVALLPQVKMFK